MVDSAPALPSYPSDPLDEKQMNEFVLLCVDKEQNYKKYSDKIGASCAEAAKTPLKIQKVVIDRIKEVIKAKPQKHTAKQKFFALKLLNKVIMKKNLELNNYVESKIMARLTILAQYNNNPEEKSAQLLLSRGKNIFGPDEPDHQNSANFLIILLDCIEKWALTFAFEEGEIDDGASNITKSKSGKGYKFYNCYTKLIDQGVKFPSTFQTKDKAAANSKKKPQEAPQANRPAAESQQIPDDAQSQSTAFGISPEKKERIAQLKKKMQKVKEMSKQAKKFIEKSGQINEIEQVLQLQQIFQENKKLGEDAINELMSDEIQPHISNSAQLAEKLFGYMDLYEKAQLKVQEKLADQQKLEELMQSQAQKQPQRPPQDKQERRNSFGSDDNANVDEGVGPDDDNRRVMSRQSMGGRASRMTAGDMNPNRQAMMTNSTNTQAQSEIQFQFGTNSPPPNKLGQKMGPAKIDFQKQPGQFDTQIKQPDQFGFDDFGGGAHASQKEAFKTVQKQPQGFDDFNFDMPAAPAAPQDNKKENPQLQNDFGFDFNNQDQQPKNNTKNQDNFQFGPQDGHQVEDQRQPQGFEKQKNFNDFDENYKSNDFQENPDDFFKNDEAYGSQFDGRKQVNKSLKNKNNMGEFQARNSQIQGRVSKLAEQKASNAAQNDFGFDFGGGAPPQNPQGQKEVPQNDGFDFQFDQGAPDKSAPSNAAGFEFDDKQPSPKQIEQNGFKEFTFDKKEDMKSNQIPQNDGFFAYGDGDKGVAGNQPPQNQGFNDFGFDNFGGNQVAAPPSNDFFQNDQPAQDFQAGGSDDKKHENASDDKTGESAFKSFPQESQESPDKFNYVEDLNSGNQGILQPNSAKVDSEKAEKELKNNKLTPNKELFDYADEMASRKKAGPGLNQSNTSKVMLPVSGQFEETTESMGSKMSEEIPEKLKNEKDKENEKEIKKLREYLQKDLRISKWWLGQQGQAGNELQGSLQQNYSFHQKSLMNKISQQIQQSEQLQSQIYSVEQENKMLSEKYKQVIDNQTEDARRVSELEFEVDSFNAQIGIIRQQCEIELRRKDQEVQEMRDSVQAMQREVQEANRKCEMVKEIEESMNEKLAAKDQEIEKLRQELSDTQLDSQLHQQKISNFDMDKRDYENQIRNLQTQLAEEISRSEISQANDTNAAAQNQLLQQQFEQKESSMKAKIAELEAQLSMALMQDIGSAMKGNAGESKKETVETKPQIDLTQSFNLPGSSPNPGNVPQIEKQLEIKQKQDSGSSGTNIFNKPRVSTTQITQSSNQNQSRNQPFLDFSSQPGGAPASQSMVVLPNQNLRQESEQAKQGAFQTKNSNSPINSFPKAFSPASSGPGATSQVVAPNPSFSFDMFGGGGPAKPDQPPPRQQPDGQSRPSSSMGGAPKRQAASPINSNLTRQQSQMSMQPSNNNAQQQNSQQNLTPRQDMTNRATVQMQPSQLTGQGPQNYDRRSMMPPASGNQDLMKPQPSPAAQQQSPSLQSSQSQPNLSSVPNAQNFATQQPSQMQNQFQQNFQHELLKQKLQSFHQNSLLQGDKCVVYEDVNVKIGLVRQYRAPQGPNGDLKCMFKVFFRNHNQQSLPMHGVFFQFQYNEAQGQQSVVRIQRSSRPMPVRVPNTPPLNHNETIELDCEVSIRPVASAPGVPNPQNGQIQGLNLLKFGSITLNLQYELNNGKKSGLLPITMPINVLNLLAPYKSLNKYEYQGIWNKVVNTAASQRPSNTACLQRMFQLDKQKVANMQKLMQAVTHCFQHVAEVDPQPNQISFAAQLRDVCLVDVATQERAWILVKMELTKDGGNCKVQCVSVKDNMALAQPVMESVLGLVAKQ